MSCQVFLMDSDGSPVISERIDFQFFVYPDSASAAGQQRWGPEDHFNVPVVDGFFELQLGASLSGLSACFDGTVKWLEVRVQGEPQYHLLSAGS